MSGMVELEVSTTVNAYCAWCNQRIAFNGSSWVHVGLAQPKHPAMPKEAAKFFADDDLSTVEIDIPASAVHVFYDPLREIQELYCELTHEQQREFNRWRMALHLGLEYAAKEERDELRRLGV